MVIMIVAVITIAILNTGTVFSQVITLRADEWCPYNCSPTSEFPGFMIEIMYDVFGRENIDYKILPWVRAVAMVEVGRFDAAPGASPSDAPGLVFGEEPLGDAAWAVAVRNGFCIDDVSVDGLRGLKIGVIDGYSYGPTLDPFLFGEFSAQRDLVQTTRGVDANVENLWKLIHGRIDAYIEERYVLSYLIKEHNMGSQVDTIEIDAMSPPFIGFSPANPQSPVLARHLDEGIRSMRASGRLQEILDRYGVPDWR